MTRPSADQSAHISASTTEAILGLVAAGVGWSLVPSIDKAFLQRRGIVARAFAPGQGRCPVRAVWRAAGPLNPAVDVALAALGDAQ